MPIPKADQAVISSEKVRDYLLNLNHPDGGSKALWFNSLGYEQSEWETLAKDLLEIALSCSQFYTKRSPYGVKYEASGVISRPDYRPGRVVTVWIVEGDLPPRLVTAYPDNSK